MPTFAVFHRKHSRFVAEAPSSPVNNFGGHPDFELVAQVEVGALDEVFGATQHAWGPWHTSPHVVLLHAEHPRSTSVGDVIVDEAGDEWLVDRVGFRKVAVHDPVRHVSVRV